MSDPQPPPMAVTPNAAETAEPFFAGTGEGIAPDPMVLFSTWMSAVIASGVHEPTAMVCATSDGEGVPSARLVLLKHADGDGFVFYTNENSTKGMALAANPRAALVFPWHALGRQVRVEGRVERVSPEASDAYFATRLRGAQIGAWASPQSEVIAGREVLDRAVEATTRRFAGIEVPRPPHWGGWRVVAERVEFWHERPDRLHDRLQYRRRHPGNSDHWVVTRLAP